MALGSQLILMLILLAALTEWTESKSDNPTPCLDDSEVSHISSIILRGPAGLKI